MELHGVIVYDILNNDCLTGTWTNTDHQTILTDNAKKFNGSTNDIVGDYVCSYIDIDRVVNSGNLTVTPVAGHPTYLFKWTFPNENNPPIRFSGIGFKFSKNKIAVSYRGH